jgi:AraC-like DNA-binding protein
VARPLHTARTPCEITDCCSSVRVMVPKCCLVVYREQEHLKGVPTDSFAKGSELGRCASRFLGAFFPVSEVNSGRALAAFVKELRCTRARHHEIARVLQYVVVTVTHAFPGDMSRNLDQGSRQADARLAFFEVASRILREHLRVNDLIVEQSISRLQANFNRCTWTQSQAAAEQGLTPAQLSTRFSRATGMTWSAYRRMLRLKRASSLLVKTQLSVKEVWAVVGYNDGCNFAHDFRRRFGVSPRTYRRLRT